MRNIIFSCLLTLLFNTCIDATRVSYEGYKVYLVSPKTIENGLLLKQWEDIDGIDFWDQVSRMGIRSTRIMVSSLQESLFIDYLNQVHIPYELIIENAEEVFEMERLEYEEAQKRFANQNLNERSTIDFTHFWSTNEINNYIDYLVSNFGDICSAEIIGTSIEGQLIRAVKISANGGVVDGSRPIIFIDAGVHAREWIAYMAGVKIMHELVQHSTQNMDILSHVDFIIIPNVNPDGYDFSHSNNRMWRKNRRVNSLAICPGVDGNRNYAHMWQSSINQCSEAFPGSGPFSEPEIQAVRSIFERFQSKIKLYASIHSFGDYVLYPWGYDFVNIHNWEQHHEVGDAYASAVATVAGTQYTVGNAAILLYTAFGVSDDYAASRGIPLSYTLELTGGGTTGFDIPPSMIPQVTQETWLGFRQFGLYTATHNWN